MTETPASQSLSTFWTKLSPALASRDFRLFWVSQIVSTTGTFFQLLAERWLIYEMTQSAFMLGVIGFIGLIPVIPISFLGGFIIDRVPRRKLLLITQSGLLLQAIVFATLVYSGQIRVWHIIFLDFVLGSLAAIDQPARQSFLTDLVGKKDLADAVALNSILFHFTRTLGFTTSGLIIASIGASGAIILNAFTYLAPIVALLLIQTEGIGSDKGKAPLKSALSEGLRVIWKSPPVLGVISLIAIAGGLSWPVYGLMPAFVEEVLQAGPIALGGLLGISGLGALLGIFVMSHQKHRKRGHQIMAAGLATPLLMLGFAASRTVVIAGVFSFVYGLSQLILQTMANTLIQINIPDYVRGRVMSVYTLLNAGMPAFAGIVVGAGANFIGLPMAFTISGAVALAYVVFVYVVIPSVRHLD